MSLLPTESAADLRAQSIIGAADVSATRQFVAGLSRPGLYIEEGQTRRLAAAAAKKFFTARTTESKSDFRWSRAQMKFFFPNGRAASPEMVKGAAHAAAREARFRLQDISLRLEQGQIGTAQWYREMKAASKVLHAAEYSLARGGLDNVTDWTGVETMIYDQWAGVSGQFPGLRRFAEDTSRGRYGVPGDSFSSAHLARASMYAEAGNATYENARIAAHSEEGFSEACRVKAAVDSCPTCIAEDGIWKPLDEVVEIGNSECGARCYCTLIFRRGEN